MATQFPPHLNLPTSNPSITSPSSAPSSGPGTPMSGVSTVAIKDGHEGSRRHNVDAAAERLTRLAALESTSTPDYFVDVDRRPEPPSSAASVTSPASTPTLDGLKKMSRKLPLGSVGGADTPGDDDSTSSGREQREKARYVGGVIYDDSVVDTTVRTPQEVAEDSLKNGNVLNVS